MRRRSDYFPFPREVLSMKTYRRATWVAGWAILGAMVAADAAWAQFRVPGGRNVAPN